VTNFARNYSELTNTILFSGPENAPAENKGVKLVQRFAVSWLNNQQDKKHKQETHEMLIWHYK
jgi:hypothetical protein